MLTQDSYIKAKLVEYGWRWSQFYGGGHLVGQTVMWCIANRVRGGWGSWLQMIDNVAAYMAENEIPPLKHPGVWDAVFVKLLHTVDGIYDGSIADMSKGGKYFADLGKIQRPWFLENIVQARDEENMPTHPRVVDNNTFCVWK